MNVHPLVVHFPIALLTVYAVFELARWKSLLKWEPWFYIKATLVITGSLASLVAYLAGDAIEDQFAITPGTAAILEQHQFYATLTVLIFGVLAAAYAKVWFSKTVLHQRPVASFVQLIERMSTRLIQSWICVALAFVGLVTITLTGALGGGFVYGRDIDPMVSFIFKLLGL